MPEYEKSVLLKCSRHLSLMFPVSDMPGILFLITGFRHREPTPSQHLANWCGSSPGDSRLRVAQTDPHAAGGRLNFSAPLSPSRRGGGGD